MIVNNNHIGLCFTLRSLVSQIHIFLLYQLKLKVGHKLSDPKGQRSYTAIRVSDGISIAIRVSAILYVKSPNTLFGMI